LGTWAGLYSTQAQKLNVGNGRCLPALEGNYYLSLGPVSFVDRTAKTIPAQVMTYGKAQPVGTVMIKDVVSTDREARTDFTYDKHVYFLPQSGYLVTLPHLNDRVVVTRLKKAG